MKKLSSSKKYVNAVTTGFIALVVVCLVTFSCYFFFVRGSKKMDEQRAGEVYILRDEIVHMGYSHSGEDEIN